MGQRRDGRQTGLAVAFAFAIALVGGVGFESYRSLLASRVRAGRVSHTHQVLEALSGTIAHLQDAESGQRGLVITGDPRHLQHFENSLRDTQERLQEVRALVRDNPEQTQRASVLALLVKARVDLLRDALRTYQADGADAAVRFIQADKGRLAMEQVRSAMEEMEAAERRLLTSRAAEAEATFGRTRLVLAAGIATALIVLFAAFAALQRDVRTLRRVEHSLQGANESLRLRMSEGEQRQAEMRLLGELSTFLHASRTSGEVEEVLGRLLPPVFPATSGATYFFRASRNQLELAASWPAELAPQPTLLPDDCWAVRLGRAHVSEGEQPRCSHVGPGSGRSACVPLTAGGEVTGLLHLVLGGGDDRSADPAPQLTQSVAAQMALALANLQLREDLRSQSIRDALTGLFNRRYLEEALTSELARARRAQRPVGVVLLDLDHFKRLNDTHGHLAGDAVLRAVGAFIRGRLRAGDIPCRFGGEEFALVLPDADVAVTGRRAEELRQGFESLRVEYRGQDLGPFTFSGGIACFPLHGDTIETLIAGADEALYRAKRGGRNRVAVAQGDAMEAPAAPS